MSSCHCLRTPVLDGGAAVGIEPRLPTPALSVMIGFWEFIAECSMASGIRLEAGPPTPPLTPRGLPPMVFMDRIP